MPKSKYMSKMRGSMHNSGGGMPYRTKMASPMGTGGMNMKVGKVYSNSPRTAPSHMMPKNQIV